MMTLTKKRVVFGSFLASAASTTLAFQSATPVYRSQTSLKVAVDPTTVSKKDYEDICGVSFDDEKMHNRLKSTKYLYPKHVEVIEDIAPIAATMVDEIVCQEFVASLVI
jgi:hypothetical protein